ncbi:outer membrane protein (porin) [Cupriavidus gilardii CR3]|uniref:porin n=1 Tax=Cupriavidus gilardii TaxID=82541 RepID=UPI0006B2EFA4|nr:porin [Cupriavidus gilardii]ALD93354.1 outer membrane protein (porin) [Cupriavidus gilardii CR3]MCT9013292.1 porin [Cupriavidus gilardii]MCT9052846.1 porin [Cupriavidus gilardii]WNG67839.1 porin [Cupriavidus gilardii]
MKKALLALAATAATAASGAASAQTNVTLYGIVDAGIEVISNAPSAGGGDTAVRMNSGNLSGSRWGLRGTEDLGGGLKGLFVLESGFDIDTGRSAQGGRLFGRAAYVGLQGNFGTISLGRQQNALYDLFGAFDPMGVSPRYSLNSVDSAFNGRADNNIKYTGKFGGLTATGFYSFGRDNNGEVPGEAKVARQFGGGLSYAAGGFSIGTAYDQYQGATVALQDRAAKRLAVGTAYEFGAAKVFAGYRWMRDEGLGALTDTSTRSNLYWAGARYKFTPAFSLTGAAYYEDTKNTGADPWMFVLSADYSLSKRTDVYLNVGYVRNKDGSDLGLNGAGTAQAGENQTGVTIGMRHRF